MAGLDTTKISNIIGTRIPPWLLKQLDYRSLQNSQDTRDNNNILFLANKTAWIRLVSSIDIVNPSDIEYFRRIVGDTIKDKSDLAKQFVLFGGTSKYLGNNSYGLRSGLGKDGAYGILGEDEIKKYGYRPMPGITNVTIDTLGKLGSLRQAIINFKCWDKAQLDIIDALYFKLGFTMFLEWGNTFFYKADKPDKLESTELYSIDPFRLNLTKEEISLQITKNMRQSEGNYDGMLGMVTNFNFSYNQDGGYDCTLKLMGLGVLGDAIKINNPKDLPDILAEEIRLYNNTLLLIATAEERAARAAEQAAAAANLAKENEGKLPVDQLLKKYVTYNYQLNKIIGASYAYPSNVQQKIDNADVIFNNPKLGDLFVLKRLRGYIPIQNDYLSKVQLTLDPAVVLNVLNNNIKNSQLLLNDDTKWSRVTTSISGGGLGLSQELDAGYRSIDLSYNSRNGLTYSINIQRQTEATISDPSVNIKDVVTPVSEVPVEEYVRQLQSVLNRPENEYKILDIRILDGQIASFTVEATLPFTRSSEIIIPEKLNPDLSVTPEQRVKRNNLLARAKLIFTFQDSSFIKSFTTPSDIIQPIDFIGNQAAIAAQNQQQGPIEETKNEGQENSITQIKQALELQSGLELTLRTIQVRALNKAIYRSGTPDLTIGRRVFPFPIYSSEEAIQGKPFYSQIFSNGIFSNYIEDLIDGKKITDSEPVNAEQRFALFAKYGFASQLMSGDSGIQDMKGMQVDYQQLLKAYVIPYQVNQEIIKGTSTNHPVYIPLGLLIMILNHSCTIYDTNNSKAETPLVYVDFNTNLNFFLTNNKQLSTNPFKVLIPFRGSFSDYQELFPTEILSNNKTQIKPLSGSLETTPLFNTELNDLLSNQIPDTKGPSGTEGGVNPYRGKLMDILLNIDYVIGLVREFSLKDGTNNIYLKTFLEQIISDINKYLGNFNVLRLAYHDSSNTFQIVDDQVIPPTAREKILPPDNTITLPLLGKASIAKSLEIKTEISSKLSNMIAISANSDVAEKATLSSNGDNFGFINTSYRDRYIPVKGDVTGSNKSNGDSLKSAAIQFNQTISDFYSKINPSEANVSQATNYYIERMSRIKNKEYPTRASTMIPVSVNFTTDGISGFRMGQGFTIPEELLPYTYNTRIVQGVQGLGSDHLNKVGFVVVGLTHTIDNNQWNTNVKANMIFLKKDTEFTGAVVKLTEKTDSVFGVNVDNPFNFGQPTSATTGSIKTSYPELPLISPAPPQTKLSYVDAKKKLSILTDADTAKSVFAILVAEASKDGKAFLSAGGYNYSGVQTDAGRWGGNDNLIVGRFIRKDAQRLREFAQFRNDNDFLTFMIGRVKSKHFTASTGNRWTERYLNSWVFLNLESKDPNKYKSLFPEKLSIFNTAIREYNAA